MTAPWVLADARPLLHPTAGQRGIGRWTRGILGALADRGVLAAALVDPGSEAAVTELLEVRPIVAHGAGVLTGLERPWFLATGMFLHPLAVAPIPSYVTAARVPVAAVVYDAIPARYPQLYLTNESARRLATLRAALARTAERCLAISEFSAQSATEAMGIPRSKILSIGSGVEPRFRPDPAVGVADIHRRIEVEGSPFVVAVVGGDPHKNTERLIDAWALACRSLDLRIRLVLVGRADATAYARWSTQIERLGLAGRVVLAGGVADDDLLTLYRTAQLAVMASIEEGFGLPAAEAAACGCVTICSDVSALAEIFDDPIATFDPFDERAMASAIVGALLEPSRRLQLAATAARAAARWRWPEVADRLIEDLSRHRQAVGGDR